MPLVSTRALILQGFPYSDTSRILRILSPEVGVRSVIAKGALRPKSRFGGVLDSFTEGTAQFFLKEGRELHTLNGFDLVRSRQNIGRSLEAFAGASLIAELVLRFGTDEPQPDLFAVVSRALDALGESASESAGWVALDAVWQVVALLGYEPHLEACVACGRPIATDEVTRFDVSGGGVACTDCRPRGRLVDPAARLALGAMVAGGAARPADVDWSLQRSLLRAFLTMHLTMDRPLRSLDLFVEALG